MEPVIGIGIGIIASLFYIAIILGIFVIPCYKIYKRAGQPAWAAFVPIYSTIVRARIAEKPGWWGILAVIPYIGMIWQIWIWNRVAKRFGKDDSYIFGIVFLGIVFLPMLGYGKDKYTPLEGDLSKDENVLDA